ncbi:CRE-GUR-5 protein [Ditylenchus destructor]|uniref:CRE-GUR-5 protein n=1 Tax=Ditylenchus destructor TaxID=166010 RepID=A0AAD4MRT9_9BILA|nr:CRE-GUR-5 protein [Ditylenchus destructor]
MRLKNSPALFLQLTGLYIPPTKDKRSCRRLRAIVLAFFLVTPTLIYYCRQVYRSMNMFYSYSIKDVMFVICWQRTGALEYLERAIKQNFTDNKSQYLLSLKMKSTVCQCLKVTLFLTLFGVARVTAYNIDRAIKMGIGIFDPTMGLHPFDFVYRVIGFYEQFLINCVVSYFAISVRCLTMQLQEFNRELEQLLQSPPNKTDFADRLMDSFSAYHALAQKVRETDKIFRVFIFCMLASGVPMMVFGTITLIRRETLVSFILATYDFIFCIVQLVALTVLPAQLYAEVRCLDKKVLPC